ncbi:MAG: hypothetical protein IKP66_08800, partial [Lachnospiraceae bacterium]|nr:hypothetical protein [Lachnospiraceae bacterium]
GGLTINVAKYKEDNVILFKECSFEIAGILGKIYNTTVHLDDTVQCNLLSNINKEVAFSEYTDATFDKDVEYLYELCCVESKTENEYNEKVLQDIEESALDDSFLNVIAGWQERKAEMYAILEAIYGNTFSLYPYEGVLFFRGKQKYAYKSVDRKTGEPIEDFIEVELNSLTRPTNKNKVESLKPVNRPKSQTTIDAYSAFCSSIRELSDDFKASMISYDRCFDMDTILNEKHSLYYPYESFGFAVGAEFSDYYKPKENDIVYRIAPVNSWKDYFKLIEPKLDKLFLRYIYKALEKYCTVKGESFKFTDPTFQRDYASFVENEATANKLGGKAALYNKYCSASNFSSTINSAIERFCRTICRASVITRNDSNELYKLRVCSEDTKAFDTETAPKKLFNNNVILQNRKDVVFDNGICVKQSSLLGIVVMDYQFCLNPEIVNAKPLFGYKAAKLFQQNGTVINKKNLLLGEDNVGTPIFSTKGGRIDTTSKIVHRFSAGSRSGKGVITMNILASLIASDTSVFYIDRKPDMASELSYITHGDMYCVNGADLQLGEDTRRQFKKRGQAEGTETYSYMLDGFKPGSHLYKQSYMTGAFGSSFGDTWENVFGDLIYERAYLFAIAIMMARLEFIKKNTPENSIAYQELDLGNNMSIVIDEITNWHVNFEHRYFESYAGGQYIGESVWKKYYKGDFGASQVDTDNMEDLINSMNIDAQNRLQNLSSKAESLREALENGFDEKTSKELDATNNQIKKLLKEVNNKDSGLSKTQQEGYLYWTTFHDKMQETIADITSVQNAGWKPEMAELHDVFMIGQMITGCAKAGAPIKFKVGKKEGADREVNAQSSVESSIKVSGDASDDATASFLVTFAENFKNDWFTGRLLANPDEPRGDKRPNFGAVEMEKANPTLYKWLHLDGNWMYVKGGVQNDFRSGGASSIPTDYVQIKPYLVLNNNLEQPTNLSEEDKKDAVKYKYVNGCISRLEKIKKGVWKKIRPDFLSEDGKTLHEGIGLKGLVKEYKRTQDPTWDWNQGNPFAKSKRIADAVAKRLNPKYNNYMDLLLDLTPAGLFNSRDIVRVYESAMNNEVIPEMTRLEQQLPRYFMSNNVDLITNNANTLNSDESVSTQDIPNLNIVPETDNATDIGLASQSNLDLVKELDSTTKQVNSVNEPTSANVFETETPS